MKLYLGDVVRRVNGGNGTPPCRFEEGEIGEVVGFSASGDCVHVKMKCGNVSTGNSMSNLVFLRKKQSEWD